MQGEVQGEVMSEAGSQDEGSVFPLRAECDLRGRLRSEDPKISMSRVLDAGSSCCKTKTVMLRLLVIGCLNEFSLQFFMSIRMNMSTRESFDVVHIMGGSTCSDMKRRCEGTFA